MRLVRVLVGVAALVLSSMAGHSRTVMAHDGLFPHRHAPQSGDRFLLYGLSQEAQQLGLTLKIENYTVTPEMAAALQNVQKPQDAVANSPSELRQRVEECERTLNEVLRLDETTELEINDQDLQIVASPKVFHLVEGLARQVPVIVRNTTQRMAAFRWRSTDSPDLSEPMNLAAGQSTRLFITVTGSRERSDVSVEFDVSGHRQRVTAPAEVTPSGLLQVRILDVDGQPTPARMYVSAVDGHSYVPDDTFERLTFMGDFYSYVPGEFLFRLPAGQARLEFIKGFEYQPLTQEVTISPSERGELTVRLERNVDLPSQGWYSGDGHIHMSYGGTLKMTPEQTIRMLQAEDLNAGNMVVANIWGDDVQDRELFEAGRQNKLSLPRYAMRWNEEYRNNLYGHLILYGITELTEPLYSGFNNTPHSFDFPPNADIADQVHNQGGFVTGAHPFWKRNEHAMDVVLGKLDGIETLGYGAQWSSGEEVLHALWNCGFRTVATAGTDSFLNMIQHDPLGGARCYAHLDDEFSYDNWVAAARAGKSFVTNSPLLFLTVDDLRPGDEVSLQGGQGANTQVRVRAEATSRWPLQELVIFCNGEAVSKVAASPEDNTRIVIDTVLPVRHSGWISARCTGPHNRYIFGGGLFRGHQQVALSSPVWITVDDRPPPPSPDAQRLLEWTDEFMEKVESQGKFKDDTQRKHVRAIFEEARRRFAALADEYRKAESQN